MPRFHRPERPHSNMTSLYGWGFNCYATYSNNRDKGPLVGYLNQASPAPENTDDEGISIDSEVLIGHNYVRLLEAGPNSPYNDFSLKCIRGRHTTQECNPNRKGQCRCNNLSGRDYPSDYYVEPGVTTSLTYRGAPTRKSSMFGGLGIGIDYPMFLGDGKDEAGNSLGKRFYSEETSLAGYSPTYPSYFNRANVHNGNFGTCGLTTQVPVPMRLDDYDSSGNRLRRENWIKISATDMGCLGIKSSGTTPTTSGQLWGWGQGFFLGGSTLHQSLQYWSNVPEICDSGSNRFYILKPQDSVFEDDGGHIAAEYAFISSAEFPLNDWHEVVSLGSPPHDGTLRGPDSYSDLRASVVALRDYKLYVHNHDNGKATNKWARLYEFSPPSRSFKGTNRAWAQNVKSVQPKFEKAFGNGCGLAGVISNESGLYLLGEHNSFNNSEFRAPYRIKTSDQGDTKFTWFNASTRAIAFVQNGSIYYSTTAADHPYSFPENAVNWGISHGGFPASRKLDNTVNAGESLSSTEWTQVYCLTEAMHRFDDNSTLIQGGGLVAINASGEVWFRDPLAAKRGSLDDGTPAIGYHMLSTDATVSASANWSMISPKGVRFKKIILSPNHVQHPWLHGSRNTKDYLKPKKMFAIIALTENGELYCSDNTCRNQYPEDNYIFPYIKPEQARIDKAMSADFRNEMVQPSGKLQKVRPWESLVWAHSQDHGLLAGQEGRSPAAHSGDLWALKYRSVDGNPIISTLPVKDINNDGENSFGSDHPNIASRGKPLNEWSFSNIETGGVGNRNYSNITYERKSTGGTARLDKNFTFNSARINDDGTIVSYCHTGKGTSTTPPSGYIDVKYPSETTLGSATSITNWTNLGTRIYVDPATDGADENIGRRIENFDNAFDMTGHNVADDGTLTGLTVAVATRYNNSVPSSSGIVQAFQYNGSDFVPLGSGIEGEAAGDLLSFVSLTRNIQNDGATSGVPSLAVATRKAGNDNYIRTFTYAHDWVPSGVYSDGSNKINKFEPSKMPHHIFKTASPAMNNLFLDQSVGYLTFDKIYNVKLLPGWLFAQIKYGASQYFLVYKWNDETFQWEENSIRSEVPFEFFNGSRGGHTSYAVSNFSTYKTNGVVNQPILVYNFLEAIETWNIETGERLERKSDVIKGDAGDGGRKNLSLSADGKQLVAGHQYEDKAAIYEWSDASNTWSQVSNERLHKPDDTSSFSYHRANAWQMSRNGKCVATLGANTMYDDSDIYRADRDESKYQWVSQTCIAEDTKNGKITFKHPRRNMTNKRDFLLDGQDLHNFYDGWEDLTVTQYPLIPSQTKFWGIR
tara:strand:+ start:8890 stop:12834 length:3945 start_codon:yes stop_codon:yes gene_type:complete